MCGSSVRVPRTEKVNIEKNHSAAHRKQSGHIAVFYMGTVGCHALVHVNCMRAADRTTVRVGVMLCYGHFSLHHDMHAWSSSAAG